MVLSVTYNTLSANTLKNQLPLSSKQALRDYSGSLKERTEEPLGSLNKVYRAHFAWPTRKVYSVFSTVFLLLLLLVVAVGCPAACFG